MTRYVREPSPGEFRGEGLWYLIPENEAEINRYFEHCVSTGWLPAFDVEGGAMPEQLTAMQRLRYGGCVCPTPLLMGSPEEGAHCGICSVTVEWPDSRWPRRETDVEEAGE